MQKLLQYKTDIIFAINAFILSTLFTLKYIILKNVVRTRHCIASRRLEITTLIDILYLQ